MPNEATTFLDEFNKEVLPDPFAHLEQSPEETPKEPAAEETTEEPELPEGKTRRERRLIAKLEAERESAIQLAARLDAVTESQKTRTEEGEYLSAIERLYGTETPEAREATEILKHAFKGLKEDAKREAKAEIEALRSEENRAVADAEKQIDSMLEELEDEFNVDLTEGKHREPFLKLMQKMSPKDKDGNIVAYADHFSVWETYNERLTANKTVNPAKSLSARSMTTGGGTKDSTLSDDVNQRWLRERGII